MKKAIFAGLGFILLCLVGVAGLIGLSMYANDEEARVARFADYEACLKHESLVPTRNDKCIAYLMGYANQKSVDPSQVDDSNVQQEIDSYRDWISQGRPQN